MLIMNLLSRTVMSFFPRLKFVVHERFLTLVANDVAVPLDVSFNAENFGSALDFERDLALAWQKTVKHFLEYTLTRPVVVVQLTRELRDYPGVPEKIAEAFKHFCAGKVMRLTIKQL